MQTYKAYTDQALTDLIEKGDEAAMSEVYDRYSEPLYRQGLSVLKDRHEAKDALQEVFSSYWARHAEVRITSSLSSYLYRAMRNQVIKRYSKRLAEWRVQVDEPSAMQVPEPSSADLHLQAEELSTYIEAQIERLPKKMRQVFRMSRDEQLSNKEIAQHLQLSEETVKTQLKNARRILRERLKYFVVLLLTLLTTFF